LPLFERQGLHFLLSRTEEEEDCSSIHHAVRAYRNTPSIAFEYVEIREPPPPAVGEVKYFEDEGDKGSSVDVFGL
jgi:hypothetical protein|tara:strand:- start:88 stop:312 length:225 start_codon:yes stop_codon:yes gene_type:complete